MKFSMFAFLLFISIGFDALADCSSNRLNAFPANGNIQTTSIFLLEGYAQSQVVINGLNAQFPVYLRSGDERIRLNIVEVHVGLFRLTQALLKPEKLPTAGKEYQLVIDNLPDYEHFGNYNSKTQKYDAITYLVTDESDTEKPQWVKNPEEKNKTRINHACGPSLFIQFYLKVRDQSNFMLRTTLKSTETKKESTYILPADELVFIGHNMCWGAFTFDEGVSYQAKFVIIDASGNTSKETEWIAFTKPE